MSIYERVDKQNVAYTYNEILFSLKNEANFGNSLVRTLHSHC